MNRNPAATNTAVPRPRTNPKETTPRGAHSVSVKPLAAAHAPRPVCSRGCWGIQRFRWWLLYPICFSSVFFALPIALLSGWITTGIVAATCLALLGEALHLKRRIAMVESVGRQAAAELPTDEIGEWYPVEFRLLQDATAPVVARSGWWTAILATAVSWSGGRSLWACLAILLLAPWGYMLLACLMIGAPVQRAPTRTRIAAP